MLGGIEHMSVYDLKVVFKKTKDGKSRISGRIRDGLRGEFKQYVCEFGSAYDVKVVVEDEN